MGQNVLHALSYQQRADRHLLYQPGFPQSLPDVTWPTTVNSSLSLASHINISKVSLLHFECLLFHRQLAHPTLTKGRACFHQRTSDAARRLWRTLYRTKVHDGLVIGRCLLRRQKTLCEGRKDLLALCGVDGRVDTEMTREHPIDIPVDHSRRQSEGDTPDGGSRIVAHALQLFNLLDGIREMTKSHNLLGGIVQITGPAVVAQSLPLAQHLVFRCLSQGLYSRPAAHKAFPVVPALLHLRLLKNDLRKPYSIRIASLPPWQLTTILSEPFQQR